MFRTQTIPQTTGLPRVQILLLVGVFAGAWAGIFGRMAQIEGVPTPVIITFRMVMGALVLTPLVLQNHRTEIRKLRRNEIIFAAAAGFWFGIHLLTGFASMQYTTILVSSVLGGTAPIWVALIEVVWLRARMSQMVWLGLGITLIGGIIIAIPSGGNLHLGNNPVLGSVLSIIAAITGSFYSVIGRKSRDGAPFLVYLWLVFIFGGITAGSVVTANHMTMLGYTPKAYFALVMLVILPQLTAHTILNYTLRRLSATYVSVVGQLGTVIGAFLAFIFFHELPTALQIPGSIAIIVGITLVNLGKSGSK